MPRPNTNTFVKDTMLEATKYSNKSKNPYTFTASMIGNELLQNYLTVVNGTFPAREVDDTTVGSVFHKGMEQIIIEKNAIDNSGGNIKTEYNMQYNLTNKWTISGTADLIIMQEQYPFIHDFKLTKMYAINKIRENIPEHNYTKQLNVLGFLHHKDSSWAVQYLVIDAFAKDAKAVNSEPVHNPIDVPLHPYRDTEAELLRKTNELQQHIESGEIPNRCEDIWPRRMRNGTTVNTKCALYCSHGKSGKCPYYNPTTRETAATIANW